MSTKVTHKTVKVGDLDVFSREAGPKGAPAVLKTPRGRTRR